MGDSMFSGGMDGALDDDMFGSNRSIARMGSGRSAMDQIFDRSRHSIGFDGQSLLSMSNGAGNFSSSTTSISFSSSNNGQPTYVKTVSSKSMRDGQGNIVSESKGYEKDSSGVDKRAFQRRVNDQYHMRAKHRKSAEEEWNTEQRLINVEDDEHAIHRFHDRFNRTSRSALQHQKEQSKSRALRGWESKKNTDKHHRKRLQ